MSGYTTLTALVVPVGQFGNNVPGPETVSASAWWLTQWSQSPYLNQNNYATNSAATYDPLYGNAASLWAAAGTAETFAIYNNPTSLGGGYVYSLTNSGGPSGEEVDLFLTSPTLGGATLNHPINISYDARLTNNSFLYNAGYSLTTTPSDSSQFEIGFTISFNGADGLPKYSGFVQILPMNSTGAYLYVDFNAVQSPTSAAAFLYQNLLSGDAPETAINEDSYSIPDFYSYNVNNYAYKTIQQYFSSGRGFSPAQLAAIQNMANWTLNGYYIGTSTSDSYLGEGPSATGSTTVTIQLSNLVSTENLSQNYVYGSTVGSASFVDHNPAVEYTDISTYLSGSVDGAAIGSGSSAHDEYYYNGYDTIRISVPAGQNWDFGGGFGPTTLYAGTGNNTYEASNGTSYINNEAGAAIINAHGNDQITVAGANSNQNTIFQSGNNTIYALSGLSNVLYPLTKGSYGLDFINSSDGPVFVLIGGSGSNTVSGGVGGGYIVGGFSGNNSLMGGAGAVTLVGGGSGDTIDASGGYSTGNCLFSGSGTETLLATTLTESNLIYIGPNADNDLASTSGSGQQNFFLYSSILGSVSTVNGSVVNGAQNTFWLNADSTGASSYVLNDFRASNSALLLVNAAANGAGQSTVSSITYGGGNGMVHLSDGTFITITGAANGSLMTEVVNGIIQII